MVYGKERDIIRTFLMFAVLVGVALLSGHLLVLFVLVISGYELAIHPDAVENTTRRVLAGHLIALITGFTVYHAIASGLSAFQSPPAMSTGGLRLIASGFVAVLVTMVGMGLTNLHHPPAYAVAGALGVGVLVSPEAMVVTFIGAIALVVTEALATHLQSSTNGTSI